MGSLHSVPSTTSVSSNDGLNTASSTSMSRIRKSRRIIDKIRGNSRQSSRSDFDDVQNLDPILFDLCDAQACKRGEEQDNSTADVGECKQKDNTERMCGVEKLKIKVTLSDILFSLDRSHNTFRPNNNGKKQ